MSVRKVVSAIALSAALLVSTTGCNLVPASKIASLQQYAPTDGAQVTVGDLKLRNAFILVNLNNQLEFYASVVNSGSSDIDARLQYDAVSGEKTNVDFPVFAFEKIDIGYNGTAPIIIDSAVVPGQNLKFWLLDNKHAGQFVNVPVLSGEDAVYQGLVPAKY